MKDANQMATALAVDTALDPVPALQTKMVRPPRPPHGVTVVYLDEFEIGRELVVEIGRDDRMALTLRANGLEMTGATTATVREYGDGSHFVFADVAVVGHDSIIGRSCRGRVNVGLSWTGPSPVRAATVSASALADGDWIGGPLRFTTVARHDLERRAIWLSMPAELPHRWPVECSGDQRVSTRVR